MGRATLAASVLLPLGACGYPQPEMLRGDAGDDARAIDARIDATIDAAIDGSNLDTIQQVQDAAMLPGTPVSLAGVIVTAIDSYGTNTGSFWLEEPGGGQYSGVMVYGVTATGLAVGDVVSLSGVQKAELALTTDTSGRTETQLVPISGVTPMLTQTGTAPLPAPEQVDALAIEQLTEPAQSQEWNKWDGVLVTLADVKEKTAPAIVGNGSDPSLQSFSITGNALAESQLAAFPSGLSANICLASVTGVITYLLSYQISDKLDLLEAGSVRYHGSDGRLRRRVIGSNHLKDRV